MILDTVTGDSWVVCGNERDCLTKAAFLSVDEALRRILERTLADGIFAPDSVGTAGSGGLEIRLAYPNAYPRSVTARHELNAQARVTA